MEPLSILAGGAGGLVVGLLLHHLMLKSTKKDFATERDKILGQAKDDAERLRAEAEAESKNYQKSLQEEFDQEEKRLRQELKEQERKVRNKESNLEQKQEAFSNRELKLAKEEESIQSKRQEIDKKLAEALALAQEEEQRLKELTGLSEEEARERLMKRLEGTLADESSKLIERITRDTKEKSRQKVSEILGVAISRLASEHTAATTTATIALPSDELKGRIIGREGRNIKAFERATGADVIVDDTPGVVVVSAFDPIRREVARRVLEQLISDGRIHPSRIEELVTSIRKEFDKEVQEIARKALLHLNLPAMTGQVLTLIGRMKFATLHGQEMLARCMDISEVCANLAVELQLDATKAKAGALFHGLGYVASHEMEGTTAQVSGNLARRYGQHADVINACAAHTGEIEAESMYAVILKAAIDVVAARPGAKTEHYEKHIARLTELETVCRDHPDVQEAHVIRAGREIRAFVDSEKISDKVTHKLAFDLAKQIQDTLTYPGEITVTVHRESRSISYAR